MMGIQHIDDAKHLLLKEFKRATKMIDEAIDKFKIIVTRITETEFSGYRNPVAMNY